MAEFMDEDAIVDAVETAEASGDCAAVVELLGRALDLEEPETALEAAADALLRLGGDKARRPALGDAGACARVAAALQAHGGDEASLAEVLLGCCRVLCADCAESAAKLLAADGAAELVRAMGAHAAAGEPTLQEQGCLAVEALAAAGGAAAREALLAAGAEAAVEAARADIVNERNKSYPDRALTALKA